MRKRNIFIIDSDYIRNNSEWGILDEKKWMFRFSKICCGNSYNVSVSL